MPVTDLNTRLENLSGKLAKARENLERHENWNHHHNLTIGQMQARHDFMKRELQKEVDDLEAHGHHVSDLEANVRLYLHGIDPDL